MKDRLGRPEKEDSEDLCCLLLQDTRRLAEAVGWEGALEGESCRRRGPWS